MAAAATLSEETIRRVLTPHEQNLLRLRSRNKSLDALAQMYRQYAGVNGVQDALDVIAEKLRRARQSQMDETDNFGGMPIRTVRRAAAPPVGDAPPSPPAARPAPPTSTASPPAPALPAAPPRSVAARDASTACDARVLELLLAKARSNSAIAHELGLDKGVTTNSLRRLEARGKVVQTGHEAFDWPRPTPHTGGRKARIWMAVGGPEFARPSPPPAAANGNGRPAHAAPSPPARVEVRAPENLRRALVAVDRAALVAEIAQTRVRLAALDALLASIDAL